MLRKDLEYILTYNKCNPEQLRWFVLIFISFQGIVLRPHAHKNEKLSMRHTPPWQLQFYRTPNGREPFTEWYATIQDRNARHRIQKRLDRLADGNFGDCNSVGGGVFERRFHLGAGYLIYFGEVENTSVLLLCGGDKSSQASDIKRAKDYWLQYKETQRWKIGSVLFTARQGMGESPCNWCNCS